ncbi:MAG: penicillin-binding protein activator [Patescibacteria group bacterium]
MNNTIKTILGLIVAILVVGGIYTITQKSSEPTTDEVIKIGVILPLSGDLAHAGEDAKNGINLAKENFKDEKIEFIFEDSYGTKQGTVSAIQKLINIDNVQIIIGEVGSGNTLSIAPIAEENKKLLLVPISASSDINTAGDYIFKFREDNNVHAEFLANFVYNKKFKNIAIMYDNSNDVWVGAEKYFSEKFTALGGQIVAIESYNSDSTDFRTQLVKIKAKNSDVIYLAGHPEQVGLILKQSKEIGINAQFIGHAVLLVPKLIEIGGISTEGLIIGAQSFDCGDIESELIVDYCARYQNTYNSEPLYYGAYTYDTTNVLLGILEKLGEKNIENIKTKLYQIQGYEGVTGDISLDNEGNVREKLLLIKTIKNGEFVPYEE